MYFEGGDRMVNFKDRKILLIAPNFYEYHTQIIKVLENKNSRVTFVSEMSETLLYRIFRKISPRLKKYLEKRHVDKIIYQTSIIEFNYVFVIRGGCLTSNSMEKIKANLPHAHFLMYQWDSLKQNNYLPIIDFFHVTKTFDRSDAAFLNIDYLPLFYSEKYKNIKKIKSFKKYDLIFVGAQHSDRYKIIKDLCFFLSKNELKFKVHLYIKLLPLMRELITQRISFRDLRFFKIYRLSTNDIVNLYSKSKAVLDIELNIQNGLSIRTFEALAGGMKLITTNKNITKELFYDPESIMIIKRNDIHFDINFFNKKNNPSKLIEKYGIDEWIYFLFGD